MQGCGQQKLGSSTFVGGWLTKVFFTVIIASAKGMSITQILH
jgi:hypothetical protein